MDNQQEIINQCIANNRQGQEKLYRMFYPALFALCRRLLPDDHEAVEALNDGMLKVYKNIASWQSSKGEFFNWIYTIVRNAALDKLKSGKKDLNVKELKDEYNDESYYNPVKELEWKDIYKLSEALSPGTRAVFNLYYLEGFSIKEIAETLDLSTGTVKWHMSSSRENLKPILQKFFEKKI